MPRGTARQAVTGGETRAVPRTVCKMTLAGLFTAEAWFGEEGVVGKEAGREEQRGGLLPSRESEFLLSRSPIWLAVVKTIAWHLLSLCRWSPSYESAFRAASGGESGWLVIYCTANISMLYKHAWFLILELFPSLHSQCLISPYHTGWLTYLSMSLCCFSTADLQKMVCWCPELREP